MKNHWVKKLTLYQTGLLQALGIAIYAALISGFFVLLEKIIQEPPQFLAMLLMLCLLVFSAAVTGLLFFGYAVSLALKNKIIDALHLLGYTFVFSLLIILLIVIVILIFKLI